MKSQIWWYTARAGGIVAWALLTVSVVWGLLLSSRVLGRRISGPKLLDLHRFLGGLAVTFTGIHLVGLVLDETVHFGPAELFIPFSSSYEPGAVAWGIVGLYVLLAVELTSLARRRIGERAWRLVHYTGFAAFALGTVHALTLPGTDIDNPVVWWPAAVACAAVVGLIIARIVVNGDPVPASAAPSDLEQEVAERERLIVEQVRGERERPEAALIERTLLGLRALDDAPAPLPVPPAHQVPGAAAAPQGHGAAPAPQGHGAAPAPRGLFDFSEPPRPRPVAPLLDVGVELPPPAGPVDLPAFAPPVVPQFAEPSPWTAPEPEAPPAARAPEAPLFPPPAPLTAPQAVSGSLFPSSEDVLATPGPLDLTVPADLGPGTLSGTEPATAHAVDAPPAGVPLPTRPVRDLPVRTPRRLARTTAAADRLDAWKPTRGAAGAMLPPAPPTAVDPVTGEPDPVAYRQWLKEWLTYVESQA